MSIKDDSTSTGCTRLGSFHIFALACSAAVWVGVRTHDPLAFGVAVYFGLCAGFMAVA